MLNSLTLPHVSLQPKLEIPIWLNFDQLMSKTKKLVSKIKNKQENQDDKNTVSTF